MTGVQTCALPILPIPSAEPVLGINVSSRIIMAVSFAGSVEQQGFRHSRHLAWPWRSKRIKKSGSQDPVLNTAARTRRDECAGLADSGCFLPKQGWALEENREEQRAPGPAKCGHGCPMQPVYAALRLPYVWPARISATPKSPHRLGCAGSGQELQP